jgi:hypothetical protein
LKDYPSNLVRLRGNNQQGEEGKRELSHLAYCGFVHEPHFPLPPPQRGIVGGNSLLETLFGLVGNGHHMRIAGRKSKVRGSVIGGDDDTGHI